MSTSRRHFLKLAGAATAASLTKPSEAFSLTTQQPSTPPDYTLRIATVPIELAPNRILSTTTYNGQLPGPLLRFKEGQPVTVDVHNGTDTPEQLHWHGQFVPVDVDGAAEEGTPYIPAHGTRRIQFTPRPFGVRFYHTHVRAAADLAAGQYNGLAGPVSIERPPTTPAPTTVKSSSPSKRSSQPSATVETWPWTSSPRPPPWTTAS